MDSYCRYRLIYISDDVGSFSNMESYMVTDKQRIEDSLIAALFQGFISAHIRQQPEVKDIYKIMWEVTQEVIDQNIINIKLSRRLDRIANKISRYLHKEDFTTRKGFLAISEWATSLIIAGGLFIEENSKFFKMLEDMGDVIQLAYKEIPDFEKIDASAINHVFEIHKIAQAEGYFI